MSAVDELLELMRALRDPNTGCPWDLAQDWQSIVPHTLEEAYEVAEVIEQGEFETLPDELGDLLFQVVFYCQLGAEQGRFDFAAVVRAISDKLRRRHPHVFGDARYADSEAVNGAWEARKSAERQARQATSEMDDIPLALPALSRAAKVQRRAARVGFDWPEPSGAWGKLDEELLELREAAVSGDGQSISDELGDVLFSVCNLARHLEVEPEAALRAATRRFEGRFRDVEAAATARGTSVAEADATLLEQFWQAAKARETAKKTGAEAPDKQTKGRDATA